MAEADPVPSPEHHSPSWKSYPVLTPDTNALRTNKIVAFDSRDIRSRPFNLLRTRLAKTLEENQARMVGLTSATPAAGKSFLSLNLAAALARLGDRPVYLVDFDLRRASLAEQLELKVETGIDAFLSGAVDHLAGIGKRVEGLPLVLFPTNVMSSNSAEALTGPIFSNLLSTLQNDAQNAVVLFDLPPVFANDDAMITIDSLDGYIMVADSGRTTRRQITDAIEMLQPAPCFGTILNRYKGGVLDMYGYYSNTYDRYYDK